MAEEKSNKQKIKELQKKLRDKANSHKSAKSKKKESKLTKVA